MVRRLLGLDVLVLVLVLVLGALLVVPLAGARLDVLACALAVGGLVGRVDVHVHVGLDVVAWNVRTGHRVGLDPRERVLRVGATVGVGLGVLLTDRRPRRTDAARDVGPVVVVLCFGEREESVCV